MDSGKRSFISEDWLSLWIGLVEFVLCSGLIIGFDTMCRGDKTKSLAVIFHSKLTISDNNDKMCSSALLALFKYSGQSFFSIKGNKHSTNQIKSSKENGTTLNTNKTNKSKN